MNQDNIFKNQIHKKYFFQKRPAKLVVQIMRPRKPLKKFENNHKTNLF